MTSKEFINRAEELVKEVTEYKYDVHLVWFSKSLQNFKAMLCTISPDNFYYEVTYNEDKNELYFDKYDKVSNQCFKLDEYGESC